MRFDVHVAGLGIRKYNFSIYELSIGGNLHHISLLPYVKTSVVAVRCSVRDRHPDASTTLPAELNCVLPQILILLHRGKYHPKHRRAITDTRSNRFLRGAFRSIYSLIETSELRTADPANARALAQSQSPAPRSFPDRTVPSHAGQSARRRRSRLRGSPASPAALLRRSC
jgi:hypothetical protein